MTRRSNLSPAELARQLRIDLPVSKRRLVQRARHNNLDDSLIRELESVLEQEFRSIGEIAAAIREAEVEEDEEGEGRNGNSPGGGSSRGGGEAR